MGVSIQATDTLNFNQGLATYLRAIRAIPILSYEEEQDLAKKLYFDNDLEAARCLVMSHLRFVVHIARTYSGYGLNISDLIQEGNVGLMKAVKRFDPRVGVRLVSFAVHWVKAEIQEFILKNWRIVKIATTKSQRKLFFNLRSNKKTLKWFSEEEVDSVATDLGVKPEAVREMEGRMSSQDEPFENYFDEDDFDEYCCPVNYLADNKHNPEVQLEQSSWEKNNLAQLKQAMELLDERSQDILYGRWLSEKKNTLHALAAKYGVSAERIRQLEKNAMEKLKLLMMKNKK